MIRRYLLLFESIMLVTQLHADIRDSLSIGLGGGYNSYKTFMGELYLKADMKFYNRNAEMKIGLNNRSYQLYFYNVRDLNAHSIGAFGDIAVYPFNRGLFAGVRLEYININWLTSDSRAKVESEREDLPALFYIGNCTFFQLGYNFKLSDKIGLKLYGQYGLQEYIITESLSSFLRYIDNMKYENFVIEGHNKFICNINLSIEFRIK